MMMAQADDAPKGARLNVGMEDEMMIAGYRLSRVRFCLTWVAIILTLGLLRLVFYWKPEWMLYCTHTLSTLHQADTVLLEDQYKQKFVEVVVTPNNVGESSTATTLTDVNDINHLAAATDIDSPLLPKQKYDERQRHFVNKKVKYLWDSSTSMFYKLHGLESGYLCSELHQQQGLSEAQAAERLSIFGSNEIRVHVTSIVVLLFTQVLNPFYVFQLFSVIVWFNDQYHYYAACILIVSILSIVLTIYETRKMQRALKRTVSSACMVSVCRDGKNYKDIPSSDLVPGDVFEVPRLGCMMQCDAALLAGNCIVNESMLTGESVPVTKTPLPNPSYSSGASSSPNNVEFSMKHHSRHVLFCGTEVIQTRYYGQHRVKAVVVRTGFQTSKGELVRSILFPKPVDFRFTQDAFKFICVMCALAMVGMVYTIVIMIDRERGASVIVLRTLDMITIVVPPALPAAMTVGIVMAQSRLKKQLVYCISPRTINLCGALNAFCFDKTGTLTEEGLDTWGVIPVEKARFLAPYHDPAKVEVEAVTRCMATCHSITVIDNQLSGDTLDLKMFEATNWELVESGEDTSKYQSITPTFVRPRRPDVLSNSAVDISEESLPYEIGILHQFPFSSSLQRMSVIARTLGSPKCDLYMKGSPEMIVSLCKPHTVPGNFQKTLMHYTKQGYRVIALAWKPNLKISYVKISKIHREQVECDVELLGLLVMENRLKEETTPTIKQLKYANIRPIMVTGDNMLTAMSVGRDCHMIDPCDQAILVHARPPSNDEDQEIQIEWLVADMPGKPIGDVRISEGDVVVPLIEKYHFVMTGKTWSIIRQYQPSLLPKIVVRGTIFARMSPEQKAQLIEVLQEVGYYVGMCGDGANDCGALRCAHAGISLSEAEASVASAFTSKANNISCVPTVIREGRAALVTSFGIFKYMACYSLTQFVTVCILYWIAANLTDFTYLYIDMILITSLSISFGYTAAYPLLVPRPPAISLLSVTPLLSIFLQMCIITSVQVFTWFLLKEQSWYVAFVPNDEEDYQCYEVTALFSVSSFQYIILAFVFSRGPPYRKPVYTNKVFMANWCILTLLTIYIVLDPFTWLKDLLELQLADEFGFRALFLAIAAVNFILCLAAEYLVNDASWVQRHLQLLMSKFSSPYKSAYEHIERELQATHHTWPPLSESTLSIADILQSESAQQDNGGSGNGRVSVSSDSDIDGSDYDRITNTSPTLSDGDNITAVNCTPTKLSHSVTQSTLL